MHRTPARAPSGRRITRPAAAVATLIALLSHGCAAPGRAANPERGDSARRDHPARTSARTAPQPSSPTRPLAAARERVSSLGHSVRGAPIRMHVFGDGADAILIFGGIHGSEPGSATVASRLVELLRSDPSIASGRTIAVIPVANPDGLAKRSRANANGVDLNRNFPSRNWKPAGKRHGARAASEPETRALMAAMEQVRPARVVSIHAIHGARECNNYDGPGEALAQAMRARNGYPAVASIGYPTPGSFGNWCGVDHGIPVVTLELPQHEDGNASWERNREALLAAIRFAKPTIAR